MKKVVKTTVTILLIITILIALFLIICYSSNKNSKDKNLKVLTERGYCNLVDAGDIKLNVPIFGYDAPEHTVVCIGGSGDSTFAPAMNNLSTYVHGNLRYAVIERPGYGLSEVGKKEMTAEYVVECSRKALESAGIDTPYILLAHSLGGIYAEYWFNKYPEEIEGVLLLDTVFPGDNIISEPENIFNKLVNLHESLGLSNTFRKKEMPVLAKMLPEVYRDTSKRMWYYNPNNKSRSSESSLIEKNLDTVDTITQKTNIPKIFLSTDSFKLEDFKIAIQFQFEAAGIELTDEIINKRYEEYCKDRNEDFIEARNLYLSKIGNVTLNNYPSSHFIYLQYPDIVAVQLELLLEKIELPIE